MKKKSSFEAVRKTGKNKAAFEAIRKSGMLTEAELQGMLAVGVTDENGGEMPDDVRRGFEVFAKMVSGDSGEDQELMDALAGYIQATRDEFSK